MKTLTRMAIFVSLILPCGKVIADDATTYEVGGLYYQIDAEGSYVEGSPTCVKVVRDADHPYAGEVTIPSSVEIEGKTYRVWKIAANAFGNTVTVKNDDETTTTTYASDLTSVVIPSSVSQIHSYAFANCEKLTNVTIGYVADGETAYTDDVYIYERAFDGCVTLATVDFGKYVRFIDSCAFRNCKALQSVAFTDRLETVNSFAFEGCVAMTSASFGSTQSGKEANNLSLNWYSFYNCTSLATVIFADNLKVLGQGVFEGCTSITDATLPSSLTSLEERTFYGCTSLRTIVIPNGITTLPASCFQGCSAITSITLPSTLTTVNAEAFQNLAELQSVTIGDSEPYSGTKMTIGDKAFYNCPKLTTINLGTCVGSIGNYAFSGSAITNVTISDSVTSIGEYAFMDCKSLTTIDIRNGITTLPASCFQGCSAITSITLPSTLTTVNAEAFQNLAELQSVTIGDSEPYSGTKMTIGDKAFYNCPKLATINLGTCVGSIGNYAFSEAAITNITIPSSVTSIGEYAFSGCAKLTAIDIPNTVKSVGVSCFDGCAELESVILGHDEDEFDHDALMEIGAYAFQNCPKIATLFISKCVGSIGNGDFKECKSITSLTISRNIRTIGESAFYNCTGIKNVVIGSDEADGEIVNTDGTEILNGAFDGCTAIETLSLYSDVKFIGNRAFYNCESLKEVRIPCATDTIGEFAFGDCTKLESAIIGYDDAANKAATVIKNQAFDGCTAMKSLLLHSNVTRINYRAFFNCQQLLTVTIPRATVYIGEDAFRTDSSITSVTVGDADFSGESYTVIDTSAFAECANLETATLYPNVKIIGASAFNSDHKLTTLQMLFSRTYTDNEQSYTKELSGVRTIGDHAFRYCESLQDFTFSNVLESIGAYAFGSCKALENVKIPVSTHIVGDGAFIDCTSLKFVKIGDTYSYNEKAPKVEVCYQAFFGCSALSDLYIGCNVVSLGYQTFSGCTSLNGGNMVCGPSDPPTVYYKTFDNKHYMWMYGNENDDTGNPANNTDSSGSNTTDNTGSSSSGETDNSGSEASLLKGMLRTSSDEYANIYVDIPETRQDGLAKNTDLNNQKYVYIHMLKTNYDAYYSNSVWTLFLYSKDMVITSVENVDDESDSYDFYAIGNSMVLDIPYGEVVVLYDVSGRCVYSGGSTTLELPHGIYIVRAKSKTAKIKL